MTFWTASFPGTPALRRYWTLRVPIVCLNSTPTIGLSGALSTRVAHLGYQYKRGAAILGNWLIQAARREMAQLYSRYDQEVYSYRFDQAPWDGVEEGLVEEKPVGSTHFAEVS